MAARSAWETERGRRGHLVPVPTLSPCLTVFGARVMLGDDSRLSASKELSHLLPGDPAPWEGSEVP